MKNLVCFYEKLWFFFCQVGLFTRLFAKLTGILKWEGGGRTKKTVIDFRVKSLQKEAQLSFLKNVTIENQFCGQSDTA
jgi:hypothetical protein